MIMTTILDFCEELDQSCEHSMEGVKGRWKHKSRVTLTGALPLTSCVIVAKSFHFWAAVSSWEKWRDYTSWFPLFPVICKYLTCSRPSLLLTETTLVPKTSSFFGGHACRLRVSSLKVAVMVSVHISPTFLTCPPAQHLIPTHTHTHTHTHTATHMHTYHKCLDQGYATNIWANVWLAHVTNPYLSDCKICLYFIRLPCLSRL